MSRASAWVIFRSVRKASNCFFEPSNFCLMMRVELGVDLRLGDLARRAALAGLEVDDLLLHQLLQRLLAHLVVALARPRPGGSGPAALASARLWAIVAVELAPG